MTINLQYYENTLIGQRDYQQDASAHWQNANAACFVVADGLGGQERGDIASSYLCRALLAEAPQHVAAIRADRKLGLQAYLLQAYQIMCQQILTEFGSIDTHTTLALVWLDETQTLSAHVGDSRVYCVDSATLLWRTSDHTHVQTFFEQGKVSEDEMGQHPQQNLLLRTVNLRETPQIDIVAHPPLAPQQRLVVCTDGFWSDTPLAELIRLANSLNWSKEIGTHIQQLAQKPHADNLTVQVIKQT